MEDVACEPPLQAGPLPPLDGPASHFSSPASAPARLDSASPERPSAAQHSPLLLLSLLPEKAHHTASLCAKRSSPTQLCSDHSRLSPSLSAQDTVYWVPMAALWCAPHTQNMLTLLPLPTVPGTGLGVHGRLRQYLQRCPRPRS